jgi:hypothetical protein
VTELSPPPESSALRTVGRYEILREVGRGGMAVVYLARQTDLDRNVALKELAAFHAADPSFVQRFLRESRVTGGLSHPNIVTVHEYFEHEGVPYIAMEYFDRGSLRPLVSRLTLAQIAGVLEGLLAGLAHAERHGVVHRDLKPENVMVTAGGGVKITDFGLAKALQARGGGSLTTTGAAVGTPAYMAPEQASGGEIGPWTDLYALGVMSYELLAGHVPFHQEEMAVAILLRHMNEPVPSLRVIAPDVDPELSDWVERLLAKEPRKRPGNAAEAWEELEEIAIRVLGPRWRREARLLDAAADDAARIRPTVERATVRLPLEVQRGRLRWALGALALAALGVAGTLAALALTGGTTIKERPKEPLASPSVPTPHVSLAAAGNSLFVADPKGRVLELAPSSLATQAVLTDAAGPRAIALLGDRVLLADGEGLSARRADDLGPVAAAPLGAALALAGGSGSPLAATAAVGRSQGRLCEVGRNARLGPCVRLGFSPSGLGTSPSGVISVADGRAGTVVLYRRVGARLAALGAAVPVGSRPHGALVSFRGRLYVPVDRGLAVVDPQSRRLVRVIGLPATAAAIWIVPFSGRLFATLPASDRVAVLDTAFPSLPPALIRAGRGPLAVVGASEPEGAGEAVYVVGEKDGSVTKLDPITGTRLGSKRIGSLGASAGRPVLRAVRLEQSGKTSILTLSLTGGSLDKQGLLARDRAIEDGTASIELWQGGIRSRTNGGRYGPLAVNVAVAPGRLTVGLRARRGVFVAMRSRRVDGRTVQVTLTRRASPANIPPSRPPARPEGGQSRQTSTIETTTVQKPKKPPTRPTTVTSTTTATIPSG